MTAKPGRIRTLSLCQSKGRAELGAGLPPSAKHDSTAPDDCQEESNRSSAELMGVNPSKNHRNIVNTVGLGFRTDHLAAVFSDDTMRKDDKDRGTLRVGRLSLGAFDLGRRLSS